MKLTLKQKAFADYYLELGNASEAARRAGYSQNYTNTNANKLLHTTTIREYIDERLKQIEDERIADAGEVLKYLTSVIRGESRSEIVVVEGTGDGCSEATHVKKAPDEKERLKAAELLAKRYGILTENLNLKDITPVVIKDDISE